MKVYQISKTIWGKKFTTLVIAEDDFDIKPHFRETTDIKEKTYMDLRGRNKQRKTIKVTDEQAA